MGTVWDGGHSYSIIQDFFSYSVIKIGTGPEYWGALHPSKKNKIKY